MSDQEDTELIPVTELARRHSIPHRTLRSAIKAGRMWGVKKATPRGDVWYSTQTEVERFKWHYSPHVKNL